MEFNVDRATFDKQRSVYLANTADYLGVSVNRLRFEAEEGADPASSPTRVTLIILPAPDGASGTEPSAEEAAARLVTSDKEELSDSLGAGINSAALKEGESDTDDFPIAIIIGVVILVAGAAVVCAAVLIYRRKSTKAPRDTQWPPAWAKSSGSLTKLNSANRSFFNGVNRSSDSPEDAHKVDLPTLEAGGGATRKVSGCRSGPPATEDPLPDGWETLYDDEGDPYYHNQLNGEVAWVRPT